MVMDSIAINMNARQKIARKNRIELRNKAERIFDLPNAVFTQRFRLNKPAFKYVLRELKRKLPPVSRSSSISPELKLAACLRFLAEGGYQDGVGQNELNLGMAQSTISVVLSEVLKILEDQLCPKWISLEMTEDEKNEARIYFYKKYKIPGIIMCIDNTHIKIVRPTGDNAHHFLNEKAFFSLNAMIICDHKQRIRYVNATYPGSAQDAFIWTNSEAYEYFKEIYDNDGISRLLGDAGYPLSPWLITPFKNPIPETAQSRFNESHRSALNIIGHTFGAWRNWCRCFLGNRQLHYSPKKAVQIVNVAAALHNIRIHFKINQNSDPDSPIEEEEEPSDELNMEQLTGEIYLEEAKQLRNEFLSNF